MSLKKTIVIVLVLALSQFANGSIFGLFGSAKPTRKPDVVVSESPKAQTDKIAYQNYLRSLARTYSTPDNLSPSVQYFPVFTYQPLFYPNYIQPQRKFMYHTATVPRIVNTATVPIQQKYPAVKTLVDLPGAKLSRPITVLPSSSYVDSFLTSTGPTGRSNNFNRLIEDPMSHDSQTSVLSRAKVNEFEIPDAQMSTTLNDLPVSGISPDYRTGGYVTKTMIFSSANNDKSRSTRKFGHAYDNKNGTKVSEEGQLIQYENGTETVSKRGQYEYIDANGKLVLVKWVADDNGFMLVN